MDKTNLNKSAGLLCCIAILGATSSSALAGVVDLTSAPSSGQINGAIYTTTAVQPAGTGVIDSFLRIQKNGNEAAYNTSGSLPNTFDQLGGNQYNRDLLLSSLAVVQIGNAAYYQFLLDINQNRGGNNELLSFNQLQVFQTTTPGQTAGSWNDAGDGRLIPAGLVGLTSVYDMNSGGGTANRVELKFDLPGSGVADMYLYLPTSAFNPANGNYVLFYSQFGAPPGTAGSNDGFEEWAAFAVPEPSTMIAGALLLIPFTASTLRFIRRTRNA